MRAVNRVSGAIVAPASLKPGICRDRPGFSEMVSGAIVAPASLKLRGGELHEPVRLVSGAIVAPASLKLDVGAADATGGVQFPGRLLPRPH